MSSYLSCELVPEMRRNTEGTVIYAYDSDTVFVNVTPSKPIQQSYWLFTGFRRVEAPARQAFDPVDVT